MGRRLASLTILHKGKRWEELADRAMDILEVLKFYELSSPACNGVHVTDKVNPSANWQGKENEGNKQLMKSYAEILTGKQPSSTVDVEEEEAVPLILTPLPQMEGGNVTFTIDESEYNKGLEINQYNVIGRLSMRKGDSVLNTLELRKNWKQFGGSEISRSF